jgi:hypothetical protein
VAAGERVRLRFSAPDVTHGIAIGPGLVQLCIKSFRVYARVCRRCRSIGLAGLFGFRSL